MRIELVLSAAGLVAAALIGCSSEPGTNDDASATGGTAAAPGTGGDGAATGGSGALGAGGMPATGGLSPTGGVPATGGLSPTGGVPGSGGTTTGGLPGTGGEQTGGLPGTGGEQTGGEAGTGGEQTGGEAGTGGEQTGGEAGTGGEQTGGTPSTGGLDPGEPLPPVYDVENTGEDCTVATTFPAFSALPSIPEFPDPFLMESGSRISTRAEWRCRRAEISAQIQHWELGTKPPPSASQVSATYSGNRLTVDVQVGSQSITLSTTISLPSSGSAPYPALIQMDGSGVPANIFSSRGVAVMSFTSSTLADVFPTRGQGPFWNLFPDDTAGAYAGWSWGVSRIIDGLELTADQNQIDTRRLAVTGCSYAGKMALWAGAFDERIALTIPEESGGGGEASWRVMASQPETENLEEAQGTGWYSSNLLQFRNPDAPKLPFDQHSLVAMVAPRAILAIENTGIDRLGSEAGGASMKAAAEVYKALEVPNRIGFSQAVASGHCAFPSSQTADVEVFVDKFLLGDESANTNIAKDSYNTDMSRWITWDTPTLQ